MARQLAEADKNGLPTDVAIKQALTQISQIQGGIKALLDSAGIVGGAAACAGTAGAACVLGLIGAAVSANQLVASAQQSFTGEEARTALVYSLEKAGYSKEEAERYQRYMDIGAVVLSVGIVGGEVAVRFTVANLGAIASVAERQAVLQALDKIPRYVPSTASRSIRNYRIQLQATTMFPRRFPRQIRTLPTRMSMASMPKLIWPIR